MDNRIAIVGAALITCLSCLASAVDARQAHADPLTVLTDEMAGGPPSDMMRRYLLGEVRNRDEAWRERYEAMKTPEQVEQYQASLRAQFVDALGGFWERTPLNARITKTTQREGYRVEGLIFESLPGVYVTGSMFVPESELFEAPYPAVLIPCGHSNNGKAHDEYQRMGALLALNGLAALCFDPIDQGERIQLLDNAGKPRIAGTRGHTMVGVGSILLGRNVATFEVWDGIRAIDYLQSRDDVDPERIGCTGNSGGGTQTSYLMSIDDRIKAASPSCYITSFRRLVETIGVQDAEQNVFGQLAFGMDHADYLMMRAPVPILICSATRDFFDIQGTWDSYRFAKRLYTQLGYAGRIDLLEDDNTHNYDRTAREAVARFMVRWLDGRDELIREPDFASLSEAEIQCAPGGQVMLMEGARSVYAVNRVFSNELSLRRESNWNAKGSEALLVQVRRLAGIRSLINIPKPVVTEIDSANGDSTRHRKLVFQPKPGIMLPALYYELTEADGTTLVVSERGMRAEFEDGGAVAGLINSGQNVLAVDVRGLGETKQNGQGYFRPQFGSDGQDVFTAYVLGRSYVGMRAEDILVVARWLNEQTDQPVNLVSIGNVGIPALHAAALEPDLFGAVQISGELETWAGVVEAGYSENELVNTVHGALTAYDLPNLRSLVNDRSHD